MSKPEPLVELHMRVYDYSNDITSFTNVKSAAAAANGKIGPISTKCTVVLSLWPDLGLISGSQSGGQVPYTGHNGEKLNQFVILFSLVNNKISSLGFIVF